MRIVVITEYRNLSEGEAKEYLASLKAQGMPDSEIKRLINGDKVVKTSRHPQGQSVAETVYQLLPDNGPKVHIKVGAP